MAAHDALGPQFMSVRELSGLHSGDFGGRVGDITPKWVDDLPHRSEDEHEEMSKQLALHDDIRKNGIRTPLTVRHYPDSAFGHATQELQDGHHRAMAAMELGLTHVPVRHEKFR